VSGLQARGPAGHTVAMASRASSIVPLAAPLASLFALTPDAAEACSPDPCYNTPGVDQIQGVNVAAIPVDGVLVLQVTEQGFTPGEVAAGLDFTVTRDGQPIAGAVESDPAGILIWRPTAPLQPGAHVVHASFMNADNEYGYDCGDLLVEADFTFEVVDEFVEPLGIPMFVGAGEVALVPTDSLEALACCDGAFPAMGDICGYAYGPYWDEGECAPTMAVGYLEVSGAIETLQDAATAGLLAYEFVADNLTTNGLSPTFNQRETGPFCLKYNVRNLATGAVAEGEPVCFGDDVADELGPRVIDPHEALAGQCSGPLYVCTVIEEFPSRWDETDCRPLDPVEETSGPTTDDPTGDGPTSDGPTSGPDSDSVASDTAQGSDAGTADADSDGQDGLVDHGCACADAPADPRALLGLLGLGLLTRRRRRR